MQVLEIEVDSTLSPDEFREKVLSPLNERLEAEGAGELMEFEDDPPPPGVYRFGVLATDLDRCKQIVEEMVTPFTTDG